MAEISGAALLVLGIGGCCAVVNAYAPLRRSALLLPTWVASWIVVELIGHVLAAVAVAAAALAALGAVGTTAGRIGLALTVAALLAGVGLIRRSRTTVLSTDPALQPSAVATPYPRSHIPFPFLAWLRRDIAIDRKVRYGPSGWQTLDVYRPKTAAAERRPAIINVHGGGWVVGSRHEQGVPLLGYLAVAGWVGFNIDYRLAPKYVWPAQIVDVKAAIVWVRAHADDYGIDPDFIAITGGSAGGHLSALAALTPNAPEFQPAFPDADSSVAACVPFYGVYDMADEAGRHSRLLRVVIERVLFRRYRADKGAALRQASPISRIAPDAPPFFVVCGSADSLIPVAESRAFLQRLRDKSSNAVHYAEMRGGEHAFDVFPSWRTIPVIEAVLVFLDQARSAHGQRDSTGPRTNADG